MNAQNAAQRRVSALRRQLVSSSERSVTERVCVLGAGSFGTAIAHILASGTSSRISVWARRSSVAEEINRRGTNRQYVPDTVRLERLFEPQRVYATSSLEDALRDATVIVVAVPSEYLGPVLKRIRMCADRGTFFVQDAVVVNLVKSLHYTNGTLTTVSNVIARALPGVPVTSLMGPNIYSEMVKPGEFAEATVGHSPQDAAAARRVRRLFSSTPHFSVSLSDDRAGVELCGGLKNVVSLAAGFVEGLKLGGNAKAAVIRAGLLEMTRLPSALTITGSGTRTREDTMLREACGIGDLILTCTRGRGRRLAAAFVNEGATRGLCASVEASMRRWADLESKLLSGMRLPDWHNARAVYKALVAHGLDEAQFPLFHTVYRISYLGADPHEMLAAIKASGAASSSKPVASASTTRSADGHVDLVGKRALVTGGANGIGKSIVRYLTACGAHVTALDLDRDALFAVQREIGCDVLITDLVDCERAVRDVQTRMAEQSPFDLLVNCAGVARFEKIMETTKAALDFQINVNYRALVLLTDAVAKALVAANKPGSVVHISSQSSTLPLADHLVYSSSKAAVDHVARIQAFELGPCGIRVNTVRPTVVLTELVRNSWSTEGLNRMKKNIPLRRFAEPRDVAKAVGWLLSDDARLVTGMALAVDGGRSMGGFGL